MNAAYRFVADIWRAVVDASTSRLPEPASSPEPVPAAPPSLVGRAVPHLLSRAEYRSLAKQAELRCTLTRGIVAEHILHFLLLFVFAWRFVRYAPDVAAAIAALYTLASAIGLTSSASQGGLSLALSNGHLVGPAALFFSRRFVSIPLRQLSLAPLESSSFWSRILVGVRLENPAGVKLSFTPHRYRRHELEAFFRVVQEAQTTAV